jgi:hypothetical protein
MLLTSTLTIFVSSQPPSGDGSNDNEHGSPFYLNNATDVIILFHGRPTNAEINAVKAQGVSVKYQYDIIDAIAARVPSGVMGTIKNMTFVKSVEPDYRVEMVLDESISQINVDDVWNEGLTGEGIDIAVLDTGIHDEHTALTVEKEVDFTGEGTDDLNGHGTHVAGIIASADSTYKGVAYGANLFNVKVLNKTGSGYASDVIAGIEWSVENGAEIISISLGAVVDPCDGTDPLSQAVDEAVNEGVVVVVAAGNNGPDAGTITSPGCAKNAITVGAVDDSDNVPSWSSRGPTDDGRVKPDLLAPGVSIVSTWNDNSFKSLSGTSMSTPHVAGIAALLLEKNPSLTPSQIKDVLKSTALDLGLDENTQGSGRVDAYAAYIYVNNMTSEETQQEENETKEEHGTPWEKWENKTEEHGPPDIEDMLAHIIDIINKTGRTFNESELEKERQDWREKINETSEELLEKWKEGKEALQKMKKAHSFFGTLSYENGIAAGDLIKFVFDESSGTILSYTLKRDNGNISVFDSITPSSFELEDAPTAHGAVWRCNGMHLELEAHDNPTGLLKIKTEDKQVNLSFDLGDNITAETTEKENIISISGALEAKLVVSDCIEDNKTVNVTIEKDFVNVSLPEDTSILFIASPVEGLGVGLPKEYEDMVEDAICDGKVGAHVAVQMKNKTLETTHVIAYADLNITTTVKKGEVKINVSSEDKEGKTIVVDIDNETLNITNIADILVIFDGENISMAENYSDILNASDDNGLPEYLVVIGSGGVQVLVSIPEFSIHTILITEASAAAPSEWKIPGFTATLMLIAAIFLIFIAQIVRRR